MSATYICRGALTDESQHAMRPFRLGRKCRSTRYELPGAVIFCLAIGINEPVGT